MNWRRARNARPRYASFLHGAPRQKHRTRRLAAIIASLILLLLILFITSAILGNNHARHH